MAKDCTKDTICDPHQLELTALVALRLAMKHKDPYLEHFLELPSQGNNRSQSEGQSLIAENSAQSQSQNTDEADSGYQVVLDKMMSLVFDHNLTNLSDCRSNEDLMDQCNLLLQTREYDVLMACSLNLTGFTSADVAKLLARAAPSMTIDQLKEVMPKATEILFSKP